jgi:hypothetical protein
MTLEERLKDFARANNGSGEIDAIVLACGRLYGEIHVMADEVLPPSGEH